MKTTDAANLAIYDQQLAESRKYMDDFARINLDGLNGGDRDGIIAKIACGLVFQLLYAADAEIEGA